MIQIALASDGAMPIGKSVLMHAMWRIKGCATLMGCSVLDNTISKKGPPRVGHMLLAIHALPSRSIWTVRSRIDITIGMERCQNEISPRVFVVELICKWAGDMCFIL
ncbi:hypothetical protein V6N12_034582 [Hibiscus sabdariffa]|uniref:Uncharacterized protein n=1 Tax=Hibiscus sabdariffa TaxID=183260 RepID=A0ABR2DHL6_9ROSI